MSLADDIATLTERATTLERQLTDFIAGYTRRGERPSPQTLQLIARTQSRLRAIEKTIVLLHEANARQQAELQPEPASIPPEGGTTNFTPAPSGAVIPPTSTSSTRPSYFSALSTHLRASATKLFQFTAPDFICSGTAPP